MTPPTEVVKVAGRRGTWGIFGTHGEGSKLSVIIREYIGIDKWTGNLTFDPRNHYVRPDAIKEVRRGRNGR